MKTPQPPETALLATAGRYGLEFVDEAIPIGEALDMKRRLNCGRRHQRAWLLDPKNHQIIRTIGLWWFAPATMPATMKPAATAKPTPPPQWLTPAAPHSEPKARILARLLSLLGFSRFITGATRPDQTGV